MKESNLVNLQTGLISNFVEQYLFKVQQSLLIFANKWICLKISFYEKN